MTANPAGGSGSREGRDGWCTPLWLATIINLWHPQYDPCSNSRSHVEADWKVNFDEGDDGLPKYGAPGEFIHLDAHHIVAANRRAFINPPYSRGQVIRWVRYYGHTDFVFLLRWAPDTGWFAELWPRCWGAWFPNQRINFEPPPGVKSSSNPYPHALYFKSRPTGPFLDALLANGYFVVNGLRTADEEGGGDHHRTGQPGGTGEGVRSAGSWERSSQRRVERAIKAFLNQKPVGAGEQEGAEAAGDAGSAGVRGDPGGGAAGG